jgi:hypothetical protein
VKAPDGGIAGVYSLSDDAPLKTGGFAVRDASFEGKSKYSEWQFGYAPVAVAVAAPAAVPAGAPGGAPAAAPTTAPAAPGTPPDSKPPPPGR